LRPVLGGTPVAQGAVRASLVVLLGPVPKDAPRLLERLERVLPDTLLFETPKEPLNQAFSLRNTGAFIGQSVPKCCRQAASTARSAPLARLRNAHS
jgi:hypothetical protein